MRLMNLWCRNGKGPNVKTMNTFFDGERYTISLQADGDTLFAAYAAIAELILTLNKTMADQGAQLDLD